ncbi:ABC-three component system middle component 6 [Maribacter dokdonensis]|uniref:ABC-three component system middle component 6 n=1 Tax=Maribacter dokdonensis TaxID=320912 RepID=UPI002AB148EF|nr:ABC-three component system middle component 6 [Maribacter dokdonensis]
MIVDKNTNPERDLYYLGGILIDVIESKKSSEIDYMDLYKLFNQKQEITINLYSLALDWLFILGLVTKGENGKIKKCF